MRRKPIFLGLPAEEFDDELLRQVHLRWPSVISFLYSSGLTPAELTSLNLKGVPFLEPELTSDSETDARMGWADLMKTIGVDTESIDSGKAFLP